MYPLLDTAYKGAAGIGQIAFPWCYEIAKSEVGVAAGFFLLLAQGVDLADGVTTFWIVEFDIVTD